MMGTKEGVAATDFSSVQAGDSIEDEIGRSQESSSKLLASALELSTSLLPVEERLRARINKFLGGYGLTQMGRAVALNWIQVRNAELSDDFPASVLIKRG